MRAAGKALLVVAALGLPGLFGGGCACDRAERWSDDELALLASLSPVPPPPKSPGNRFADDERAARLGRALFFDPRLSADGSVSCASCHEPARAFTDGRARARGLAEGTRNTPTLLGAAHLPFLTWDGRKDSVWSQALAPLEDEREHGASRLRVARVVARHHREAYEALFGPLPASLVDGALPRDARPVFGDEGHPHHRAWSALPAQVRAEIDRVFVRVGKCLEAYLRRLAPGPAPFDAYVDAVLRGAPDADALLSASARRGLRAFLGEGQCVHCHSGPLFTDGAFHNLGLPLASFTPRDLYGRAHGARAVLSDPLRCGSAASDARACPELSFLDPSFEDFVGAFKTPTLRNVAKTAPYMHGGQLEDLEAVVRGYRDGFGEPAFGHRDLLLDLVSPDLPVKDLVAFLEALTGAPRPADDGAPTPRDYPPSAPSPPSPPSAPSPRSPSTSSR